MFAEVIASLLGGLVDFFAFLLLGVAIFLIFLVVGRVAALAIWRFAHYRARVRGARLSHQRSATLRALARSLMNGVAFVCACIFILSQFIPAGSVATTLGLFSAGLGFAARPFISDVLGGIVLLLKDQFALGEKVEIGEQKVVGVVEQVSLTTTRLRGEAGELWLVPNGDVRTIRNFSRGSFSPANLRLTVPTSRLDEAIELLQAVIASPGPDVIEPPEIISEEGEIGETTSLMLRVKARHGAAPQVRRRLLATLQRELAERRIVSQAQVVGPRDDPGAGGS